MDFLKAHPLVFIAAILGQLLLVVLLAILYIRKGKHFKIIEVVTLIIAPAVSAFAFVYVTFLTMSTGTVGEIRSKAESPTPTPMRLLLPTPTPDPEMLHILFRKVPTTITAVTVATNSASTSASLTFTWPQITSTPEVRVTGYHVSFGIQGAPSAADPFNGIFTKQPAFTASDLQKGKTYELRVWARLATGDAMFLKPVELSGKQTVLFTYLSQ